MYHFHYKNKQLYVEDVSVNEIAKQYGTPCYIYSRAALTHHWQELKEAFGNYPHRICYAVKANSSLGILNILAQLGSGFDIVSQGELERVLKAGGHADQIVFSGVGKTEEEIIRALELNLFCFDVESHSELLRLNTIAKKIDVTANIALRINPNIDAQTHPYIATGLQDNKFGIDINEALPIFQSLKNYTHLNLIGIACHIGSQLTNLTPFLDAVESLVNLVDQLKAEHIKLDYINMGGGLGIRYHNEIPPTAAEYVTALINKISPHKLNIIIEPGRSIIANAGILLTRVEYLKKTHHKNFAIVDGGMNDLIRPALYEAWHNIIPVEQHQKTPEDVYDIVGPVCESADFLGKDRKLGLCEGDLLAVCSAGAYGFSMSSNYNSRPRAAEIVVDGNQIHLIRERETIADLFQHEKLIS